MRKSSTWYFAVIVLLNGLFVWVIPHANAAMVSFYHAQLEGKPLPLLTDWILAVPWWPFVFLGGALIGGALSLFTNLKSETLNHGVITALAIEVFALLCVIVAYVLPLIPVNVKPLGQ